MYICRQRDECVGGGYTPDFSLFVGVARDIDNQVMYIFGVALNH